MSSSTAGGTPSPIHIEDRVSQIKALLMNKVIAPMVQLDDASTEDIYSVSRSASKNITHCLDKKVKNFTEVMHDLGGKLLYIKSGTTGHAFKGVIPTKEGGEVHFAVKIVAYPLKEGYGDPNDVKRPENAELLMLKALSYFVINDHTPHLVLPIATFNANVKEFVQLSKYIDSSKYDQFVQRHKNGEFHEQVSVLISEWVEGGDLLDYLRKHYKTLTVKEWTVMFFQIISTLAVIQEKFPGFRHNDLKPNNVLVQPVPRNSSSSSGLNFFIYNIGDMGFMVPNTYVQLKVWDFDFACIPGVVNNAKVEASWTSKINVTPTVNRYYDLHYFFNMLTKKGFLPQFFDAPEIPQPIKDFVRRVVPEHLARFNKADPKHSLVTERGRILTNEEYTTPRKVLETDPLFARMRKLYGEYTKFRSSKT